TDLPWQRYNVKTRTTDGGICQKSIQRDLALAPSLCQSLVFEDWQHETGITHLFDESGLEDGSDLRRDCHGTASPEGLLRKIFDRSTDRDIPQGCGRKVDAQ